jgi:putative spermidine/putrescine transport system ATP-binding protein
MSSSHGEPAQGLSIELKSVSKVYPKSVALDNVDLSVKPGEFMVFLGPSGSGKTTTLNLIAGFDTASMGEVLINGEDVTPTPVHKRNLGVVFQHYALFPHMTVAENIAFPLKRRRVPKSAHKERIEQFLIMVGLGGYGRRYPRELSGGQQQRVALARALVFNPKALLLDEPFGALDKKLRETLQLEVRRIHAELGTTFMFVTHDQDEAMVLADRVAVFRAGGIEQIGTPEELYADPASLFVAEFMGDSTIIKGDLRCDGASWRLDSTAGALTGDGSYPPGKYAAVIRPENVWFEEAGTDIAPSVSAVEAVIEKTIYMGSSVRVDVILADGGKGLVRTRDTRLLEPGQRVLMCWRTAQASVLRCT